MKYFDDITKFGAFFAAVTGLLFGLTLMYAEMIKEPERPVEDYHLTKEQEYHLNEVDHWCDSYGVQLKIWNWETKEIHVIIPKDNYIVSGSDAACQSFGIFCEKVLDIYDDGWLLYVESSWVPSIKHPIDLPWAKELAQGY